MKYTYGALSGRIITSIVNRIVKKKLGINPYIDIMNLDIETEDDQVFIRLDTEIRIDEKDVFKLIKGKES